MAKQHRRHIVNTTNDIQPIEEKEDSLTLIDMDNQEQLPYQNFMSSQDFYYTMQNSCFAMDNAMNEIVQKKFTGMNLRNMSNEDAIEAFKALDTAKANRTKQFIDLANHMANNDFFKKMAEIERLKAFTDNKIIDIKEETQENLPEQTEQSKLERNKQQEVIRMLQIAVTKKLEQENTNQ